MAWGRDPSPLLQAGWIESHHDNSVAAYLGTPSRSGTMVYFLALDIQYLTWEGRSLAENWALPSTPNRNPASISPHKDTARLQSSPKGTSRSHTRAPSNQSGTLTLGRGGEGDLGTGGEGGRGVKTYSTDGDRLRPPGGVGGGCFRLPRTSGCCGCGTRDDDDRVGDDASVLVSGELKGGG